MRTILIADGRDFYDITDFIPSLVKHWEEEGEPGSEGDAIFALMCDAKCDQYVIGENWLDAAEKLVKYERREE